MVVSQGLPTGTDLSHSLLGASSGLPGLAVPVRNIFIQGYELHDFTRVTSSPALLPRTPTEDDQLSLVPSLGLPLLQAFVEFDQGHYDKAMELLYPVRYQVVKIGGSDAQVRRETGFAGFFMSVFIPLFQGFPNLGHFNYAGWRILGAEFPHTLRWPRLRNLLVYPVRGGGPQEVMSYTHTQIKRDREAQQIHNLGLETQLVKTQDVI